MAHVQVVPAWLPVVIAADVGLIGIVNGRADEAKAENSQMQVTGRRVDAPVFLGPPQLLRQVLLVLLCRHAELHLGRNVWELVGVVGVLNQVLAPDVGQLSKHIDQVDSSHQVVHLRAVPLPLELDHVLNELSGEKLYFIGLSDCL